MPHTYNPKDLPFKRKLIGISEKTMTIHHDKLYVGYVNKRNEIEKKLETVDRSAANATYSDLGELKRQESFAANGQILHESYFNVLGGEGSRASGALLKKIEENFGSYEKWEEDFKACGMAARGWVVLAYDTNDGYLHNYAADSHNTGGIWGAIPIVVLDVYEHAYFIDYGSDRKAYIEDYMKNLNWQPAEHLYESLVKLPAHGH
ncbi:MAG: superoxide dismutase [Parcubacteria group bacterium]|nr:superoxide dismutase [Parcubacteria group bacterium]